MDQVMKVNGMRMLVMVIKYSDQKLVKNIIVNSQMLSITEKLSLLIRIEEKYLEILEMINLIGYILSQENKKIN
jgi:hypothetical protein